MRSISMISSVHQATPMAVTTSVERFLRSNKVTFSTITEQELQQAGMKGTTASIKTTSSLSTLLGKALEDQSNILLLTANGGDFVKESFLQLYTKQSFTGKTLFILPDTTTCEDTKRQLETMMFSDKRLKITALETLAEKQQHEPGDILITSGPVLQAAILGPTKAPALINWLASVHLVVLPDLQNLSLAKTELLFSILHIISPQQVFVAKSHERDMQAVEQFLHTLTGTPTTVRKYQLDNVTKQYFMIEKDFTFSKRVHFLHEQLDQGYPCILFTQNKTESQKLQYDLQKALHELDLPVMDTQKGVETDSKIINLDMYSPHQLKQSLYPAIKHTSAIYITSQPFPHLKTSFTSLNLLFMGLPKRTSEFFRYEESITSALINGKKNIVVLGGNEYDRLVVSSKILAMQYLTSHTNQVDYIRGSTLETLFMTIVNGTKNVPLTDEQISLVTTLQLARIDGTNGLLTLTETGKHFVHNYLLFKKKKYTVFFQHDRHKSTRNKKIDLEGLDVLYYPGTIHYEDGLLQVVDHVEKDAKGNKKPVFKSIQENKRLVKLYRGAKYRTFVEPDLHYEQDTVHRSGLTRLHSTPAYLYKSYIDKQDHPFKLVTKRERLSKADTTVLYGQVLSISFYEQPINMAMVLSAWMHALRILYDIDYKTIMYSLTTKINDKRVKVHEALLIDRSLSDLFKILDIERTLLVAQLVLHTYFKLNKLTCEAEPKKEWQTLVVPLPTQRYHPAHHETFSLVRIQDCFAHLEQACKTFQQNPAGTNDNLHQQSTVKNEAISKSEVVQESFKGTNQQKKNTHVKRGSKPSSFLNDVKTTDWNELRTKIQHDFTF